MTALYYREIAPTPAFRRNDAGPWFEVGKMSQDGET